MGLRRLPRLLEPSAVTRMLTPPQSAGQRLLIGVRHEPARLLTENTPLTLHRGRVTSIDVMMPVPQPKTAYGAALGARNHD